MMEVLTNLTNDQFTMVYWYIGQIGHNFGRFWTEGRRGVFAKSRLLVWCHCETGVLCRFKQSLRHIGRLLREKTARNDTWLGL
jgi:hypothetical protein